MVLELSRGPGVELSEEAAAYKKLKNCRECIGQGIVITVALASACADTRVASCEPQDDVPQE